MVRAHKMTAKVLGKNTSFHFKPWPNGPAIQVVASDRKLNLRRDLRWVAKRLASFFASTRKSQKKTF